MELSEPFTCFLVCMALATCKARGVNRPTISVGVYTSDYMLIFCTTAIKLFRILTVQLKITTCFNEQAC